MNRFDYVRYDNKSQSQQDTLKRKFMELETEIDCLAPGRAKSLAQTKLEESYMWCGKALRDEQIARNRCGMLQEERKDG